MPWQEFWKAFYIEEMGFKNIMVLIKFNTISQNDSVDWW